MIDNILLPYEPTKHEFCIVPFRLYLLKKFFLGVTLVLAVVTLAPVSAGPVLDLPDGNRIEILSISHGTTHIMDTRTVSDKTYNALPDSIKRMYSRKSEGGQMSVTGPDSIAFSFVFRNRIVGTPALADYYYILSDPSGWYQSGELKGMFGGSRESYVTGVRMVPRASQSLKLSVFSPSISLSIPSAPLASVTIDNPQYDSTKMRKSAKLPEPQLAGFCQVKPIRFQTGVYLEDFVDFPQGYSRASDAIPSSVENLSHNKPVAAKMPQEPHTVLLFETAPTTSPLSQLTISSVKLIDSHGSNYDLPFRLYHRENMYALILPKNIPVTDGDVSVQMTFAENPAADSHLWQSLAFNPTGPQSSLTLTSGSKQIRIIPEADPRRFKLEMSPVIWGEHFGNYAVEILGADNQSIPFQYEDQGTDRDKHTASVSLNDSTSTDPYQVRFASPILHTVRLTGVPERP